MASACADDNGCVLGRLNDMAGLVEHAQAAAAYGGLHLQPRKCVLAPVWTDRYFGHDSIIRDILKGINDDWA
eukprot:1973575-Pyramimonas_sp.AAC.1